MSAIEERLRAALSRALRDRDAVAMGALRSTLAALGNATAVPTPSPAPAGDSPTPPGDSPTPGGDAPTPGGDSPTPGGDSPTPGGDEHVAGSVVGLGAAEAPRRELTEAQASAIVRAEIAERTAAAEQYGQSPAVERLRAEAALLGRFLD